MRAGLARHGKLTRAEIDLMEKWYLSSDSRPRDYKANSLYHFAAMLGAEIVGVRLHSLADSIKEYKTLLMFQNDFESRHGTDAFVRILTDLIFEVRDDDRGMTYRELAVLCALYSRIGNAQRPVRIIKAEIRSRMMGYKSLKILGAEIANRGDGARPYTERQVLYTLDELHRRRFFARARANERQTYFSNKMDQGALEKHLFEMKTRDAVFDGNRIARDRSLMDKIRSAKNAASPSPLLK